jgi:ElaB/YqjD/DUF883 family membrane-anchored ribosome-binding protein
MARMTRATAEELAEVLDDIEQLSAELAVNLRDWADPELDRDSRREAREEAEDQLENFRMLVDRDWPDF